MYHAVRFLPESTSLKVVCLFNARAARQGWGDQGCKMGNSNAKRVHQVCVATEICRLSKLELDRGHGMDGSSHAGDAVYG